MRTITIAIDGHSSCGKSTMAKALAKALGYIYVDTGAMYRAVTLYAIRHQLFSTDETTVNRDALQQEIDKINISFTYDNRSQQYATILNGENVEHDIRTMAVSQKVSQIAAIPFVREALVHQQRAMRHDHGIVMDGRDIGTTVFPDAEMKVFVTATAAVRAQRRYDELLSKGMPADYNSILHNIEERDYLDSHRDVSPLQQAPDAILLDNSYLTPDDQNRHLLAIATTIINT